MITFIHSVTTPFRSMFRKPGFAVAVIVILALGIGINVATLGLLYRYYMAPMPYPQGNRLVQLYMATSDQDLAKMNLRNIAVPTGLALEGEAPALSSAGIYDEQGYNLAYGSRELRLSGTDASASLFTTLGVNPLLGHLFRAQSMEPGAQPVVVLSYRLWQTLFNGSPSAIGKTLHLNGKLYTVIGVMPKSFRFPTSQTALWTPRVLTAQDRSPDMISSFNVSMLGRLAPGASMAALNVQANAILNRQLASIPTIAPIFRQYGIRVAAQSWRSTQTGNLHQSLILVLCATLLLMLLVWFNLANLFLTRTLARRGDLALRRVLGASNLSLVLSAARESLILSFIGAFGGIAIGHFLISVFAGSSLAVSASAIGGNSWVALIVIAVVLAIVSAAIFTPMSLGVLRGGNLALTLRGADARASAGPNTKRLRMSLISGQIALACAIVGTGLLLGRGLLNLNAVSLGFSPEHVITFKLSFPEAQYPLVKVTSTLNELHAAVARLPGIEAASVTSDTPFDGQSGGSVAFPRPWDANAHSKPPVVFETDTGPDYVQALGMQLVAGRNFLPSDTQTSSSVALIDMLAAKQLFGTENAVGREFSFNAPTDDQPGARFRVVGVVNTVHRENLAAAPSMGNVYADFNQAIAQNPTLWGNRDWYLAVRSPLAAATLVSEIQNVAHSVIPGVPLYDIKTMNQRVAASLASNRLLTMLVLLFAVGALVLAAVGLYALQANAVTQRMREFAIRAALGANRSRLLAQVLGETARLLVIGLVIGLAGLAAIGVAFASAFYGIGAVDPAGMLIVVIVLALAALAASWVPAWRASRVPPMQALRE